MARLSKTVVAASYQAPGLELTLNMPDKSRVNVRFSDGNAHITDSEVLKVIMTYPTRNKMGAAGFTIVESDAECKRLIAEAENETDESEATPAVAEETVPRGPGRPRKFV